MGFNKEKFLKARRSTTVDLIWEDVDSGARENYTARVSYNHMSNKVARALNESAKQPDSQLSQQFAEILQVQFFDGETSQWVEFTRDEFDELGQDNLLAINDAIRDDVAGKKSLASDSAPSLNQVDNGAQVSTDTSTSSSDASTT